MTEWMPISTCPKKGKVLIPYYTDVTQGVEVTVKRGKFWANTELGQMQIPWEVILWMPLAPPTEANNSGKAQPSCEK